VPKVDAAVVERMHGAGAVILGKTNVPEMGYDWQSYNDVFGVTRNPWNPARTAGGSSGGSAAALAAGLGYLSVGSDLAGSIRIPAHFCGIYGHKPTVRTVPLRGHSPFVPGQNSEPPVVLSVAGPMARTAEDLAAALDVMRGNDAGRALPAVRGRRLSQYRVGYVHDHSLCPVTPAVGDVLGNVVDLIGRNARKTEQGWPEDIDPAVQLRAYEVLLDATLAAMSSASSRVLASKGRRDSTPAARRPPRPEAVQEANRVRVAAQQAWRRYFTTHDVFVLPTAFIPAFEHDTSLPMTSRILKTSAGPRNYLDLRFWIIFASLAGNPATTAPVGLTPDGLPVGVQIIGPYLEDHTPIEFARHLAGLIGGFVPPPLLFVS
jgi:amidase